MIPVMWSIWTATVVLFAGLYVYRHSLERDEEDQIFLDDSFEQQRSTQAAIVARVSRVDPFVRVTSWLVAVSSVFVICYYALDFYHRLF